MASPNSGLDADGGGGAGAGAGAGTGAGAGGSEPPAKSREGLEQEILARAETAMAKRAREALKAPDMYARLSGQADETKKVLAECKDAILAAAKVLLKRGSHGNASDDAQVRAPLRQSAEKMVGLELDNATVVSAAQRTGAGITAGEGSVQGDIAAQFKAQFDAIVSARPADVLKRHAAYQSVVRVFDKAAAAGDDVEVEGEDEDEALLKWQCPFSKAPMENPVKHRQCGHVINQASLDMLLKKGTVQCPFRGCVAPVKKQLYEPDDDLRMRFEAAARASQRAAKKGDAKKKRRTSAGGGDDPIEA